MTYSEDSTFVIQCNFHPSKHTLSRASWKWSGKNEKRPREMRCIPISKWPIMHCSWKWAISFFYYHTIWNCWKAKSKRKWPISQRKINQPFSNRSVYFVTWPIFVIAILGHSKSPWIKFWSGSCIRVQT